MRRVAFALIIAAVLLILVGVLLLNALFVVQRIALVQTTKGDVQVRADGSDLWRPLAAKERVRAGDTVRTGPDSLAELSWVDGTRVQLSADTVLKVKKCTFDQLDNTQTSLFRLDVGKVWVRLIKVLSRGSKFDIETPAATAGVRGTIFSVSVEPDGATTVCVYRGSVAVVTGQTSTVIPERSRIAVTPDRAVRNVTRLSKADEEDWRNQRSIVKPHVEVTDTSIVGDVAQIAGIAEPGAQVRVKDRTVSVDGRGRFTASVNLRALPEGGVVDVVVTDRYGVQSTLRYQIQPPPDESEASGR